MDKTTIISQNLKAIDAARAVDVNYASGSNVDPFAGMSKGTAAGIMRKIDSASTVKEAIQIADKTNNSAAAAEYAGMHAVKLGSKPSKLLLKLYLEETSASNSLDKDRSSENHSKWREAATVLNNGIKKEFGADFNNLVASSMFMKGLTRAAKK